MDFKIDENLPVEVADLLAENGHDATTVLKQRLGGEKDPTIAAVCKNEKRTLLILDTDFADIQTYPPEEYYGLIVLRLKKQDKPHVLSIVARIVRLLPNGKIDRHLWIVEEERIRIRSNEE